MPPEFEQIIKSHCGRIAAIARQYADQSSVDDLYQEILEQLWRSYGSFRGDSRPETWIYRVGFNTAMTWLRKTVRERRDYEHLDMSEKQEDPGGRSEAEILQEFFDSLGDVDASVLMMYLDGLTGREMAGILGVNVNAVQVRINRIKKAFSAQYLEAE